MARIALQAATRRFRSLIRARDRPVTDNPPAVARSALATISNMNSCR
jgi:hypothetical protein